MDAANSKKTAKAPGRPFAPGKSGNPSGRPKQTPEQKDALEAIRGLTPKAVETMRQILDSPRAGETAKLRVCEIILERTYGKASASVELNAAITDADFVLKIADVTDEND